MRVVFMSPAYPPEMQEYTRGLSEIGATVYGVGDSAQASLPPSLKRHLAGYLQVPKIMDDEDVMDRVSKWLRGREIDRVLANWEPLQLCAAKLRERWGLQVLVDLTIALVLLMPHLIRDARARGIPAWPFVVATVFLGSMGPLAYAVVRGWRARPGHTAARVATPAT